MLESDFVRYMFLPHYPLSCSPLYLAQKISVTLGKGGCASTVNFKMGALVCFKGIRNSSTVIAPSCLPLTRGVAFVLNASLVKFQQMSGLLWLLARDNALKRQLGADFHGGRKLFLSKWAERSLDGLSTS